MKIKISEENKILIYTLIIVSLGLHINIGIINDLTVMYLCSIIPFLSETVSFYAKENKLILISHLLHRAEKMSKYKYRSLRHRRIAYNKEQLDLKKSERLNRKKKYSRGSRSVIKPIKLPIKNYK